MLKRQAVRMHSAQGLKGITWYDGGAPALGAVLAVPIIEGGGWCAACWWRTGGRTTLLGR